MICMLAHNVFYQKNIINAVYWKKYIIVIFICAKRKINYVSGKYVKRHVFVPNIAGLIFHGIVKSSEESKCNIRGLMTLQKPIRP